MDIFNRINEYAEANKLNFEAATLELIREGNLHPRDLHLLPEGTVDDGFHSRANGAHQEYEARRWKQDQEEVSLGLAPTF